MSPRILLCMSISHLKCNTATPTAPKSIYKVPIPHLQQTVLSTSWRERDAIILRLLVSKIRDKYSHFAQFISTSFTGTVSNEVILELELMKNEKKKVFSFKRV